MAKDRSEPKTAAAPQAPSIAQHRKKLGDRERFDSFDRKEPRRAQQLKAAAKKDKRAARGADDGELSVPVLVFVIVSFSLFVLSAGYLIVANLLPAKEE